MSPRAWQYSNWAAAVRWAPVYSRLTGVRYRVHKAGGRWHATPIT